MTQQELREFFEAITAIHSSVSGLDKKVELIQSQVSSLIRSEEDEAEHWRKVLDPQSGLIVRVGRLEDDVKELKESSKVKEQEKRLRTSKIVWTIVGVISTVFTGAVGAVIAKMAGV